jgi:hypothetical protein
MILQPKTALARVGSLGQCFRDFHCQNGDMLQRSGKNIGDVAPDGISKYRCKASIPCLEISISLTRKRAILLGTKEGKFRPRKRMFLKYIFHGRSRRPLERRWKIYFKNVRLRGRNLPSRESARRNLRVTLRISNVLRNPSTLCYFPTSRTTVENIFQKRAFTRPKFPFVRKRAILLGTKEGKFRPRKRMFLKYIFHGRSRRPLERRWKIYFKNVRLRGRNLPSRESARRNLRVTLRISNVLRNPSTLCYFPTSRTTVENIFQKRAFTRPKFPFVRKRAILLGTKEGKFRPRKRMFLKYIFHGRSRRPLERRWKIYFKNVRLRGRNLPSRESARRNLRVTLRISNVLRNPSTLCYFPTSRTTVENIFQKRAFTRPKFPFVRKRAILLGTKEGKFRPRKRMFLKYIFHGRSRRPLERRWKIYFKNVRLRGRNLPSRESARRNLRVTLRISNVLRNPSTLCYFPTSRTTVENIFQKRAFTRPKFPFVRKRAILLGTKEGKFRPRKRMFLKYIFHGRSRRPLERRWKIYFKNVRLRGRNLPSRESARRNLRVTLRISNVLRNPSTLCYFPTSRTTVENIFQKRAFTRPKFPFVRKRAILLGTKEGKFRPRKRMFLKYIFHGRSRRPLERRWKIYFKNVRLRGRNLPSRESARRNLRVTLRISNVLRNPSTLCYFPTSRTTVENIFQKRAFTRPKFPFVRKRAILLGTKEGKFRPRKRMFLKYIFHGRSRRPLERRWKIYFKNVRLRGRNLPSRESARRNLRVTLRISNVLRNPSTLCYFPTSRTTVENIFQKRAFTRPKFPFVRKRAILLGTKEGKFRPRKRMFLKYIFHGRSRRPLERRWKIYFKNVRLRGRNLPSRESARRNLRVTLRISNVLRNPSTLCYFPTSRTTVENIFQKRAFTRPKFPFVRKRAILLGTKEGKFRPRKRMFLKYIFHGRSRRPLERRWKIYFKNVRLRGRNLPSRESARRNLRVTLRISNVLRNPSTLCYFPTSRTTVENIFQKRAFTRPKFPFVRKRAILLGTKEGKFRPRKRMFLKYIFHGRSRRPLERRWKIYFKNVRLRGRNLPSRESARRNLRVTLRISNVLRNPSTLCYFPTSRTTVENIFQKRAFTRPKFPFVRKRAILLGTKEGKFRPRKRMFLKYIFHGRSRRPLERRWKIYFKNVRLRGRNLPSRESARRNLRVTLRISNVLRNPSTLCYFPTSRTTVENIFQKRAFTRPKFPFVRKRAILLGTKEGKFRPRKRMFLKYIFHGRSRRPLERRWKIYFKNVRLRGRNLPSRESARRNLRVTLRISNVLRNPSTLCYFPTSRTTVENIFQKRAFTRPKFPFVRKRAILLGTKEGKFRPRKRMFLKYIFHGRSRRPLERRWKIYFKNVRLRGRNLPSRESARRNLRVTLRISNVLRNPSTLCYFPTSRTTVENIFQKRAFTRPKFPFVRKRAILLGTKEGKFRPRKRMFLKYIFHGRSRRPLERRWKIYFKNVRLRGRNLPSRESARRNLRVTLRISNVLRNPSTLCYFPTSRTTVENIFQKRAFTRPKFPFVRKRAILLGTKEGKFRPRKRMFLKYIFHGRSRRPLERRWKIYFKNVRLRGRNLPSRESARRNLRVTLRISNVLRNPSTLCYFPTSRTTVENIFQKRAFTRPKFPFVRKRAILLGTKEGKFRPRKRMFLKYIFHGRSRRPLERRWKIYFKNVRLRGRNLPSRESARRNLRVTLRISNVLRNPSTLCYFPTSRTTVENIFQKRAFTRPKFPFVRKRAILLLNEEEPCINLRISNVLRNPSTLCYFLMS